MFLRKFMYVNIFYLFYFVYVYNVHLYIHASVCSVKPSMIPFFYAVKLLQHYYERLSF